ncbi:MAG: histidine--tRNA ligase [Candidatus Saccharibacteria bacterium]|nr:histidine--tRNA ligase [Candidatus Saccharibacteria bacterium]
MALSTQPYKGARDFYPEDKRVQDYMFSVMRDAVEQFGYESYDAPILEPLELYAAKTGQEIVDEQTYTFTDRGDRQVAIRPEMTPTVSRMVAGRRQELAYPLRWYSIPNLWRYERPQRGRLREHWQLNVDLFGLPGLEAEHEIILLADQIMKRFGAKRNTYVIRLNSRELMDAVLGEYIGLDETQSHTMRKLIDRMHKLDDTAVESQMDAIFSPTQRDGDAYSKLKAFLEIEDLQEIPVELQKHESIVKLQKLMEMLRDSFVSNVRFDPTLMRGFDYYTDVVFEIFDTHPDNNRSMFGGGRYDGLVGLFGVDPVPTIGFGVGDVTLKNFLETHQLLPELQSPVDVYAVLIGDVYTPAQRAITELREMGINVAVDSSGRKADKQIKAAVKQGIRHAVFIGEKELDNQQFTLKDLKTGQEEAHSLQKIVSIVKDYRSR